MSTRTGKRRSGAAVVVLLGIAGVVTFATGIAVLSVVLGLFEPQRGCDTGPAGSAPAGSGPARSIVLGPPGTGARAGATEYGGPGDPSSGTIGSSGTNLVADPDSYAELGGTTFQTATAMGGLPYMTPLRITWSDRSAIAYKRDIGLGGGPVDRLPRVIDLWWQFAGRLGIPYENGLWSGPVRIERPPATGAGNLLAVGLTSGSAPVSASDCTRVGAAGVPLTPGARATLLTNGLAAAPASAPTPVKEIIAAGNQIAGKPYVYGGGHGLPLSEVAPSYDCSSSVEHLLYGARMLPMTYAAASSALESFGQPGPGRWVTLYASADHVFMYVAGLRWDTHDAAGPGDGSTGIGWHPLVRSSAGFVARHPVGL